MKKYYYSDGQDKFGPISIEELRDKDLKPDSLIWYKGLEKWRLAKNIEELNFKFDDQSEKRAENKVEGNTQSNENSATEIKNDAQIKKKLNHLMFLCVSGIIILLILISLFYNTAFEYYFTIVSDLYNKEGLINDHTSFERNKVGFNFIAFLLPVIIIITFYIYRRKRIKN